MVEISPAAGYLDVRTDLMPHRVHDAASRRRDYAVNASSLIDSEDFAKYSRAQNSRSFGYKFMKRLFDIVVSSAVILIGVGPGLILALFIWRSTGGSPIYSQTRVGLYGKRFRIYKLRTMVADADKIEKYFSKEQHDKWQRERKVDDDPRITRLGDFLRRTSIDEIPNFANVLLGQMSTVGPRAVSVSELKHYSDLTPVLLSVRPGVTGLWQVSGRNSSLYETGDRQRLELSYVARQSFEVDCAILLKTIGVVFRQTGQ